MKTEFSRTLTRLRKETGFPTAYRFYHDNGGSHSLLMTYREYLLVEQGKRLPNIRKLRRLLHCLRLIHKSTQASELVTAWLRNFAGEETFSEVLEPLIHMKMGIPGASPLHKAMNKALTGKKHYITPAQLQAIYKNRDNYLCFLAMSNDDGAWTAEALGEQLGIKRPVAEKSLKEMLNVRLLRKDRQGRYICPLANAMLEFPQPSTQSPELFKNVKKYQEELITSGETTFFIRGAIRADSAALADFYPMMRLNLSTAHTYHITSKTPKSALFAVEGRVIKLRDF